MDGRSDVRRRDVRAACVGFTAHCELDAARKTRTFVGRAVIRERVRVCVLRVWGQAHSPASLSVNIGKVEHGLGNSADWRPVRTQLDLG